MIRFLLRLAISVAAAAVGLVVAASLLDRMSLDILSLIVTAAIFAVISGLFDWFASMALRRAPLLRALVGLATTFLALLITDLITDGLSIRGVSTWVIATLIVWGATLIASMLLPWILIRAGVDALRDDRKR